MIVHQTCSLCIDAARLATTSIVLCDCGVAHGKDGAKWPLPPRKMSVGVVPRKGLDMPLGSVPEPSARPFVRPPPEPEMVARVRRLIYALRPYGPGPDIDPAKAKHEGTGATMEPRPGGSGPKWDVTAPRDAFKVLPPALEGDVCATIASLVEDFAPDGKVTTHRRATLEYLRVRGTLVRGYNVLCIAVARAVASKEDVALWDADGDHGRDRSKAWGGKRITQACDAWDKVSAR